MRTPVLALTFALLACSNGDPADTDSDSDAGPAAVGRCVYANPFSGGEECKEYVGAGWTPASAEADCDSPLLNADAGVFTADVACSREGILGLCYLDEDEDEAAILVFPGTDPASCGGVRTGCSFGQGRFEPAEPCAGDDDPGATSNVFIPFAQVCAQPLPDEPEGAGPEGQVCTIEGISACTEEGRDYIDYASCDPVLTQRPYVPYDIPSTTPTDDPRLDDAAWLEEFAWVTGQVSSCACVCCHSTEAAPRGPSGWYIEQDPIWIDGLSDDGLAMLAGWVDSTAFGAIPPEDNNHFDRETTGLPTSDIARMVAFLTDELDRRGKSEADFVDTPAFGGPLADQLSFTPQPCGSGQAVAADGTITWTGGGARYLYIMDPGSSPPGVPPNLDLPEGTRWRVDVAPADAPIRSGVVYGQVPSGATQAFPATGAPAALSPGETVYLYVLRDVYQPLTRCLAEVGG